MANNKFIGSGRSREGGFPAVNKVDFNFHVVGSGFRHGAVDIDMEPNITVFSGIFDAPTVQGTLQKMADFLQTTGQGFISIGDGYQSPPNDFTVGSGATPTLTDAFNAAFNHTRLQNGGIILVKSGIYRLTGTVNVPAGISIMGEIAGTTIIGETSEQSMFKFLRSQKRFNISTDGVQSEDPLDKCTLFNIILADNLDGYALSGAPTMTTVPMIDLERGANLFCEQVSFIGKMASLGAGPTFGRTKTLAVFRTSAGATDGTVLVVDKCTSTGTKIFANFNSTSALDRYTVVNSRIRVFGTETSSGFTDAENCFFNSTTEGTIRVINNILFGNDTSTGSSNVLVSKVINIQSGTPEIYTDENFGEVTGNVAIDSNDVIVVTDGGSNSSGGQHDDSVIDNLVAGSGFRSGYYLFRQGSYTISNAVGNWNNSLNILGADETINITLDASRSSDIAIGNALDKGVVVEGVNLKSASASARYDVRGGFVVDGTRLETKIDAGALILNQGHHVLRGIELAPNSTLQVNYGIEHTGNLIGTVTGVIEGCVFDEISSAALAPDAIYHLFDMNASETYSDISNIVFKDCTFSSSDSGVTAMLIEDVFVPVKFINCEFNALTGSGNAWALRTDNCKHLTFENCLFTGFEGQIARLNNTGGTFKDCRFSGGSGSALTNPQLLDGYGHPPVAGFDGQPLTFINCNVIYNTSSVESASAPNKAIVELGGNEDSAASGQVIVDGMTIRANSSSVGVHNYSTVLLHGNVSGPQNRYRNVTIDANNNIPTGGGTLNSHGNNGVSGPLLEVVDLSTADKVVLENVVVHNVASPSSAHARGVVSLEKCLVYGLTIDGSATGSSDYQEPIITIRQSDVHSLHMFPEDGLGVNITNGVIRLTNETSRLFNIKYHHRGGNDNRIVRIDGGFSGIYGGIILVDTNLTVPMVFVATGGYVEIDKLDMILSGTSTAEILDVASGAFDFKMTGSLLRWNNTSADTIATIDSARSLVQGNRFLTTNAINAPAVTHTGTNKFPSTVSDENILAANGFSLVPTVF